MSWNYYAERKKELLQREIQLLQPGKELSATPQSDFSLNSTVNVRTIADLLNEFSGENDNFSNWKRQAELLQHTYHLYENSMRILISLKLRGKTLKWFHSTSDHLKIPISTHFDNIQRLFGYKPNRLALRREFEKRV